MRHAVAAVLIFSPLTSAPLPAQDAAGLVPLGQAARERRDPRVAIEHYRAALALDSTVYTAHWELALSLIDLGSDTPDPVRSPRRDSLYAEAERHARRAVELEPDSANGWFALANAMGRASLTMGNRERVRRAAEIRDAARRAVEIDPAHDGAWHVLGRWHAEIRRLSGVQRFLARAFLGGGILSEASWDSATAQLERAVALEPRRIFHRLDLAEVYIDRKRYADARRELEAVAELPVADYGDERHQRAAAALLERIAGRQDG